jgi:hypothetical protein
MDTFQRFLRRLPGPWGDVAEPNPPQITLSMVSGTPSLKVVLGLPFAKEQGLQCIYDWTNRPGLEDARISDAVRQRAVE